MYRKKLPLPIHWHEGMFLQPHHFQQQVRYLEEILTHRTRLLSPYQWGVSRLELDREAIASGRFAVQEVEAILRDGMVLQTEHLARPLERDLTPFTQRLESGEALRAYLAVPKPAPKMIALSPDEDVGYPVRYLSHAAPDVADETTGSGETPINRLKVNAKVLLADEDPAGYEVLPIAEIGLPVDLITFRDYVPPTVIVLKDSPVAAIVRRISRTLADATRGWVGESFSEGVSVEEGVLLDVRLRVSAIASRLAVLDQMVELECYRPIDFYLALCGMVGEFSALASRLPGPLPRYDHLELGETFLALEEAVNQAWPIPEHIYDEIPVYGENGKYALTDSPEKAPSLRPDHLDRTIFLAVKGATQADSTRVDGWMRTNCIIGRRDQILEYRDANIIGIDRELQDPPPIGLRLGRGWLVYRLVDKGRPFELLRERPDLCFIRRATKPPEGTEAPESVKLFVRKGD